MVEKQLIPVKFFKKIIKTMPLVCVDLLVIAPDKKFLLGKRINQPAKGRWWFIGGRIFKGEKLKQAIGRHLKKETGITKFKILKQLGIEEFFFKNSAQGPATHTIAIVYLVKIFGKNLKPVDSENSEMRWCFKINKNWHPYIKEMLRRAGFKK